MLAADVCPEQARMVLPQSMMTTWIWTGSLLAWTRIYNLRIDPHSQREVQEVAAQIGDIIKERCPVSWTSLVKNAPGVEK
jgi:thymidylate synthase (FAD)